MLSLAKTTILWNLSVKVHRCVIYGVVATSISVCDVCTVCRVVSSHATLHAVHTSQTEILVATVPHLDVIKMHGTTIKNKKKIKKGA
jgi:hypothetical protein